MHCLVIPRVLRSLTSLTSLSLSESPYVCFRYNSPLFGCACGSKTEECIYSIFLSDPPLAAHCNPHLYPHLTPFILLHFLKIREHGVVSRPSINSVRNLAQTGITAGQNQPQAPGQWQGQFGEWPRVSWLGEPGFKSSF